MLENMSKEKIWVIASGNQGKITEINDLLASENITLKPQSDYHISDVAETASTFVENALIKARHACTQVNFPCLADDSGLVVPALNGEPGLYSARYAGTKDSQDNINKLLSNLKSLPNHQANQAYPAFFYCVLVLLRYPLDPSPIIAEGRWYGEIIFEQRGSNGFGYDPIFFDPKANLTAAQMPPLQKQSLSHRGQALQNLLQFIKQDH